jgi:uncharacterized protein (TIGR03083 family)
MLSPQEAVAALDGSHREVHALLAGISPDQLEAPATIGDGEWSAKDLVGHLTTWEEIALAAIDEWRAGERPAIEDTFAMGGGDALNADEVARKSTRTAPELLEAFDEVHGWLRERLRGVTPEEWTKAGPYEIDGDPRTLGSLIGGVLGSESGEFQHFAAHRSDLHAFSAPRMLG